MILRPWREIKRLRAVVSSLREQIAIERIYNEERIDRIRAKKEKP